ncbi:YceD family protein [Defluviimonas sp. SAOS-178_SWC]|uniref:YceD family protein n=1 Tax=Defluviimonas sp. SAOS-178_SWC TaxID=3121287 RepID=UPI003221BFA0
MTFDAPPFSHPVRVTELAGRKPTRFDIAPDAGARARIAAALDILSVEMARLQGELRPAGRHDWTLDARLTATVTQACIVTLAPVTIEIDEAVVRRFLSDMPEPEGDEVEMPEDDSLEPLPETIDLGAILVEALALALPAYPRADGAKLGTMTAAAPGAEPLDDDAIKPFAGLADLMKKADRDE